MKIKTGSFSFELDLTFAAFAVGVFLAIFFQATDASEEIVTGILIATGGGLLVRGFAWFVMNIGL